METENTPEVFGEVLYNLNAPRAVFTKENKLDPTELVEGEATQTNPPPRKLWGDTAPHPTSLTISTVSRHSRHPGLTSNGCPRRHK